MPLKTRRWVSKTPGMPPSGKPGQNPSYYAPLYAPTPFILTTKTALRRYKPHMLCIALGRKLRAVNLLHRALDRAVGQVRAVW